MYNDIDWSSLLAPTSILPPDISLKLIPEGGTHEDGVLVKAHRVVLTLLSPVLKIHISEGGEWEDTGSEITLKDVAAKPFLAMMDFFYKKNFKLSKECTVIDLFEILKVADRFEVTKLVEHCKDALKNLPIDLNSLVDTVNTAKGYASLTPFESISEEIIKRASDCLSNKVDWIKNSLTPEVLNSVDKSNKLKIIVGHVEAVINIIESETSKECKSCGVVLINNNKATHDNMECKVIFQNMVLGARVAVTQRSISIGKGLVYEAGELGRITESNGEEYVIEWDDVRDVRDGSYGYKHLGYALSEYYHVPMKYIRD